MMVLHAVVKYCSVFFVEDQLFNTELTGEQTTSEPNWKFIGNYQNKIAEGQHFISESQKEAIKEVWTIARTWFSEKPSAPIH